MGLAEQQALLARIYTDATLREEFFTAPLDMAAQWGLSADDAQHLARLPSHQVSQFAASLYTKRLNEVQHLVPCTLRALGERFAPLFRLYVPTHVPQGTRKHPDDAIAFVDYLHRSASQQNVAPWIIDVARYEAAWLYMMNPSHRSLIRRFRYPVGKMIPMLAQQQVPTIPARQASVALWLRLTPKSRVQHVVLSLPALTP
jgi:hypothetical protein